MARELWGISVVSFGFELGDAKRVLDLLRCRTGLSVKKDKLPIWSPIPSCFMWIIWRKKNLCVFDERIFVSPS